MGHAEDPSPAVGDADEIARLGSAASLEVAHEDPGVAVLDARDGFAVYFDDRFGQATSVAELTAASLRTLAAAVWR
jgi:hypothetical protein